MRGTISMAQVLALVFLPRNREETLNSAALPRGTAWSTGEANPKIFL
jgi:hypothetical protein